MEAKVADKQLTALLSSYLSKEQKILDKLTKEDRLAIGRPIKNVSHLDRFTANGVKYVVRTSLTARRFEKFEKSQVRVGYGVDFSTMFQNIRKSYDFLNKSKIADASVILYNIMNGIKDNLDARENEILTLCTLFVCRENEDPSKYDENLMAAKIEDWKEEGIAMEDFFSLAFSLVSEFIPILNSVSESISETIKTVKNEKRN